MTFAILPVRQRILNFTSKTRCVWAGPFVKTFYTRTGREAGQRPASRLCGSLKMRGLAVKDPVCKPAQGKGYPWGVALELLHASQKLRGSEGFVALGT